MINKIKLGNFQGHSDSLFDLDNGINAIVGKTNNGKTALIRALHWVLFGSIKGTGIIKRNTEKTEVSISFDSNLEISREKSAKNGKQTSDIIRINENELKAFGNSYPEEPLIASGFSEINFQLPNEKDFLISESNAEITRKINELTELDFGSKLIKEGQSQKRDKTAIIRYKQSEADQKQKTVDILDNIPDTDRYFELLETKEKNIAIISLLESYISVKKEFQKLSVLSLRCQKILSMIDKYEEYTEKQKENEEIINLIFSYLDNNKKLSMISEINLQSDLSVLLELTGRQQAVKDTIGKISDYIRLKIKLESLSKIDSDDLGKIEIFKSKEKENLELTDTLQKYIRIRKELAAVNIKLIKEKKKLGKIDYCDICGSEL